MLKYLPVQLSRSAVSLLTEAIAGLVQKGPRRFLYVKGRFLPKVLRKRETSSHQASVLTSAANTWGCCGRHLCSTADPCASFLMEPVLLPSPHSGSKVRTFLAMGLKAEKPPCHRAHERLLLQPREASSPTNIPDLVPESGHSFQTSSLWRRGQVLGLF